MRTPSVAAPVAPLAVIGTGAWLNAWPKAQARLQQLGVPQLVIDSIGRQLMTEPELDKAVHAVQVALQGGQESRVLTPLTSSATNGTAPGTQPQAPGATSQTAAAQQTSQDQAQLRQVLAKHAKRGIPKDLLQQFGQAATSARGLDATLTQLEGRMDDLHQRGWVDKFAKAGADGSVLWNLALGGDKDQGTVVGPMPTDDKLAQTLVMLQRAKAGTGRQALEAGVSLIPGVQAAEYLGGKNVIAGSDIRKHDTFNQILAGASAAALGVVVLAKLHSTKTLMSGVAAARDGFSGLVHASGHQLAVGSQAAALKDLAGSGKLTLPKAYFNKDLRVSLSGMANIEAAARARSGVGTKLDTVGKTISDDVLRQAADGQLIATSGKLAGKTGGALGAVSKYAAQSVSGQSGRAAQAVAELRDGAIVFNRKLRVSNGTSQLVGIVKAGGDSIASGSGHLADRLPALTSRIAELPVTQQTGAGETLAGMALSATGKAGRDGKPARDLNKLLVQNPSSPALAWYRDALAAERS
ncbi:MAG: hypothetical protein ABI200_03790 [Gaiellales bacterium]